MNERGVSATDGAGGHSPVWLATVFSLLLLAVLVICGWLLDGWLLARSILIGGVLVNVSFWLLQRDARRVLERVSGVDAASAPGGDIEKSRFFLRLVARFIVLGLVLFVLASQVAIDVIGLTVGFATVMVSVVIIGSGVGKRWLPSKV